MTYGKDIHENILLFNHPFHNLVAKPGRNVPFNGIFYKKSVKSLVLFKPAYLRPIFEKQIQFGIPFLCEVRRQGCKKNEINSN